MNGLILLAAVRSLAGVYVEVSRQTIEPSTASGLCVCGGETSNDQG